MAAAWQWLRRTFAHSFPATAYPTWGFVDLVGVPLDWNIGRAICRAHAYGSNSADGSNTAWKAAAGVVHHSLGITRGALTETTFWNGPANLTPAYVREASPTGTPGWYALWSSETVATDQDIKRTHSTGGQGQLDVSYTAQFILGPLIGEGSNWIYPNVALYAYVDVLVSRPE